MKTAVEKNCGRILRNFHPGEVFFDPRGSLLSLKFLRAIRFSEIFIADYGFRRDHRKDTEM